MISASPSPVRVLKFGGAALADGAAIRRAAEVALRFGGPRPVVIVSAVRGVTSLLEELARGGTESRLLRIRHRSLLRELELSSELLDPFLRELESLLAILRDTPEPSRAHLDHLLSFGERMSARVVAAHLRDRGHDATAVDAHDLGLVTETDGDEVRLLADSDARIRAAIAEVEGVPVVTGFLAADRSGRLTTLGRNGSDLSAIVVARALAAEEIQLWKCVAGVQTADPALVPDARTIPELGFDQAVELARLGARVLHHGAALAARDAGIPVVLRDVRDPEASGTRLVTRSSRPSTPVLVTLGHAVAAVSPGIGGERALLERLDRSLDGAGLAAGADPSNAGPDHVAWRVERSDLGAALRVLHDELAASSDESAPLSNAIV